MLQSADEVDCARPGQGAPRARPRKKTDNVDGPSHRLNRWGKILLTYPYAFDKIAEIWCHTVTAAFKREVRVFTDQALRRMFGSVTVVTCLLLHPSVTPAQEIESEVPARETAAESRARKAAEVSRRAAGRPADAVTFDQVLADPDNVELNFRYARSQVARGDLKGAAATLERILLINPDLLRVKLFYGIVLFRLDNLEESERILRAIREQPMAKSLQGEIDQYLREIRLRRKLSRYSTSLSLGYEFDTNRNAAPRAKRRLLADTAIPLGSGTSRKRRDTSVLTVYNFTANRDLGMQRGHEVFGSVDYYLQEQISIDDLDLQAMTLRAGGVIKTWLARIIPSAFFDHMLLSRETFLRTPGAQVELQRECGRRLTFFGTGRWGHEVYEGITENSVGPERTGDQIVAAAGGSYVLTPTMRLASSLTYNNKDAKFQYNAYEGYELNGTHTWIWPKGQFFITSFSWTRDEYNEADTAISAVLREDDQFRLRLTYGLPLAAVFGQIEPLQLVVKKLTATVTYEQFRSVSTVVNYTYDNSKFLMMLSKTVEF